MEWRLPGGSIAVLLALALWMGRQLAGWLLLQSPLGDQTAAFALAIWSIKRRCRYVCSTIDRPSQVRCTTAAEEHIAGPPHRCIKPIPTATRLNSEDIAAIVAFLASDDARYRTGQVIRTDGDTTANLSTYSDARGFFGEEVP